MRRDAASTMGDAAGRVRLLIALGLFLCISIATSLAQPAGGLPKDKDKDRSQPAGEQPKTKTPAPPAEPKPDVPVKPKAEPMKFPPGFTIIVDDLKKALSQMPDAFIMTPAGLQWLLDKAREKDKKTERDQVYSCKMTGKLEDDFVLLRAEFLFETEQPRAVVSLGFKGAFLEDAGDLDGQELSLLPPDDDGSILVRANRPGKHKLTLSLKAKAEFRRAATTGGDWSFVLGLPGASLTRMSLDLPRNIKEIRWKGKYAAKENKDGTDPTVEKAQSPGHWDLSFGAVKSLELSWKEQSAPTGGAPFISATGQITVTLAENEARIKALLTLEGQPKEWQLLLPKDAKVDVELPPGVAFEHLPPPESKSPNHIIRFKEPYGERFNVVVQVYVPRAGGAGKLPVGPFFVQNAFPQQGTIFVEAPAGSLRGQRLIFHKFGETFPKNVPKAPLTDIVAKFEYGIAKGAPANKAPLEIEWRAEKGQVETFVEHQAKLRRIGGSAEVEVVTRIKVKSLSAGVDFLDVQLPRSFRPRTELFSFSPFAPFPASVPWPALVESGLADAMLAVPREFSCDEESEMSAPDALGKTRIKLKRPPAGKDFSLTVISKYAAPDHVRRFRVELPRPLGILDKGGRVTIAADEQTELLVGSPGAEDPVPVNQVHVTDLDFAPTYLDLAWQPYRPKFPAINLTDVTIQGKIAHLRQQITLATPRLGKAGHLRLRVPDTVLKLAVISGGKFARAFEPKQGVAWLELPGAGPGQERVPLVLEFDQALPRNEKEPLLWKVPLIWPEESLQLDATIRVWTEPGILPEVQQLGERWQQRGSEIVAGRDTLPVLVLQGTGAGPDLDLVLKLPPAKLDRLPVMMCDRALIQVSVDKEGNQLYRARYVVRKFYADAIDLELPGPADICLQSIQLDGVGITNWSPLERTVVRIPIERGLFRQNVMLDIRYKLAANAVEGNQALQNFQTVLHGPIFRGGEVQIPDAPRWLVSLPPDWVSVVAASDVQIESRWTMQNWLLETEPSVQGSEPEEWLTQRRPTEPEMSVSQVFRRSSQEALVIFHLPRNIWLAACSVLVLTLALLLYFAPLPRTASWGIIIGLGLLLAAAGMIWPTWLPPLMFGMQPGLAVIVLLLAVHWFLHERYRRRVVFMPGFTRVKPGSSLLRSSGKSGSRSKEKSTIDAPQSMGLHGDEPEDPLAPNGGIG